MPPQAIEIEDAVLGAIIFENRVEPAKDIFQNENCFYKPANAQLWDFILDVEKRGLPCDLITLTTECKGGGEISEIWTPFALTKLTMGIVSTANFEGHCRIIQEKHLARKLIEVGNNAIRAAYQDDIFDVLEYAEDAIFDLTIGKTGNDYQRIASIAEQSLSAMINFKDNPKILTGVDTGFPSLNKLNGGWQDSDLIILAARPGMGKTALALNYALNAANTGVGVGFFTLEMSAKQLFDRLISIESKLPLTAIKRKNLTDSQMEQYVSFNRSVAKKPLFIDDEAAITLYNLRTKARKMKAKHGIGLLIIDYLQLMTNPSERGNREQLVSSISQGLKALAKNLNIPIIALSQLSRAVEGRAEKRPILSDLRESGAIEQDANMVIFPYRESYGVEKTALDPEKINTAELIIAKNRDGETTDLAISCDLSIQYFYEPMDFEQPQQPHKGFSHIQTRDFTEPNKSDDAPF